MHSTNCIYYSLVVDHIFHITFRSVVEVLNVVCDYDTRDIVQLHEMLL